MMAVHVDDIVTSGSDGICKHFPVALIDKIPANNFEELAWHNGQQTRLGTGNVGDFAETVH